MEPDAIDHLRAIKKFATEHGETPACADLALRIQGNLNSLRGRIFLSVTTAAENAGLCARDVLQKTANYQRLVGVTTSPTFKITDGTMLPIIDDANNDIIKGATAILAKIRETHQLLVEKALTAAEATHLQEDAEENADVEAVKKTA